MKATDDSNPPSPSELSPMEIGLKIARAVYAMSSERRQQLLEIAEAWAAEKR